MIHPNMCTMLGFVTTDAKISKKMLQEALSEDVKDTYNMVSVDGPFRVTVICVESFSGDNFKTVKRLS